MASPSLDQRSLVRVTLTYGVGASVIALLSLAMYRYLRAKRTQQRVFAYMFTKLGTPCLSSALDQASPSQLFKSLTIVQAPRNCCERSTPVHGPFSFVSHLLDQYKSRLFAPLKRLRSSDANLMQEGDGCIRILEIGIGSGSNLKYYPKGSRLISVEPNPFFERFFMENIIAFPDTQVEQFIEGTAEDMSAVASDSVDVVVSTHVLCSVGDVAKCLAEVRRVLAPGGRFMFVEHVSYPEDYGKSRRAQGLAEGVWRAFNDDCRLTRDVAKDVSAAGFSQVHSELHMINDVYYLMRPHLLGTAIK